MSIDPRIPLGVQPAPVQNPLEVMTAVAQMQEAQARARDRGLAAQEAVAKRTRQAQIDAAYEGAVTVDPATGRVKVDRAKLVAHLPGALVPGVMKELDADEKSALDIQQAHFTLADARRKHLGSAAQTVRAAGYDPQMFGIQLRGARDLEAIDQETYERLSALPPEQIQPVIDSFIAQAGGEAAKLEKITTVDPATGQEVTKFVTPTAGATYPVAPKATAEAGFTLSPGQTRYGPGGTVVAAVPPTPPTPHDERLVQVIGPTGQPIWVRESQAVGKPAGAAPGETGGVKLSAAQQEDIATMLTVEQLAGDVQRIGEKAGEFPGVGPIAGRGFASARGSGGPTGETLRNKIGNIQGTIAKLRGGTSFTPSEQALLDQYTPTVTDTDAAIRTKLANLTDFIQKKRANTLRVARGEYTLPPDAGTTTAGTTSPPPTAPRVGDQRRFNGRLGEWDGRGWKTVD